MNVLNVLNVSVTQTYLLIVDFTPLRWKLRLCWSNTGLKPDTKMSIRFFYWLILCCVSVKGFFFFTSHYADTKFPNQAADGKSPISSYYHLSQMKGLLTGLMGL